MTEELYAPWTVGKESWDLTEYWVVEDSRGEPICMEPTEFSAYPEGSFITPQGNKRDAALIAALPELLEALEGCMQALEPHLQYDDGESLERDAFVTAAYALKKAMGE